MKNFTEFNSYLHDVPSTDWEIMCLVHELYNRAIKLLYQVPMDYSDKYVELRILKRDPESGDITDVSTEEDISTANTIVEECRAAVNHIINTLEGISQKYTSEHTPWIESYAGSCLDTLQDLISKLP